MQKTYFKYNKAAETAKVACHMMWPFACMFLCDMRCNLQFMSLNVLILSIMQALYSMK